MKNLMLFIKGFRKGFREFGYSVSNVVNFVLLFIVYFTVLGITSIIGKLNGKRFLSLKSERNKKSFWTKRSLEKKTLEDHFKQF